MYLAHFLYGVGCAHTSQCINNQWAKPLWVFHAWEETILSVGRAGGTTTLCTRLSCYCCTLPLIKGPTCMQTLRKCASPPLTHDASLHLQCLNCTKRPCRPDPPASEVRLACEGRRIQTRSLRWWRVKRKGKQRVGVGAQLSHWALVSDDGCVWGRATYQIGGEAEVGVRASMHVGEDVPGRRNTGVARVHQRSFFIRAHRDCAHMQIYKHSGISQKRILPFRQTAALCRDRHWKPPSHAPIFPFF